MNSYIKTTLNTLFDKYPGYLFDIEEYSNSIIVSIRSKSSGLENRLTMVKTEDTSRMVSSIEDIIDRMREEELKRALDRHHKNSFYGLWPNKYSITPKELIFQDEKTTIINWTDGTKTIVKCSDDDVFSPEAGIALCYMKKFITDNDSERFHRLLKSLISNSKFKKSKQENNSSLFDLFDCAGVIKGVIEKLYTEAKHDIDTGASDNSSDNDSDGSAVEVEP